MNNAETAAKSVEISKSLINKEAGFHDFDLYVTKTIGNTARLAANLRKRGIISYDEIGGISQVVKQDFSTTIDGCLPILQDLGWLEINKTRKDTYIQEYIPPMSDVLGTLGGEVWEEKGPTEVDIATTESLSLLKATPITKEDLISEISVPVEYLNTSLDYGSEMNYFGTFYSSDDEEIVWTPFYWPEKTDKILKYLKRQSYEEFDKLERITKVLSSSQGMPIEKLEDSNFIKTGISYGFFPSVGIRGRNQLNHEYVFKASSNFGINHNNDIFELARRIVGCIRHGQHHAEVSKIRYPALLVRALRENRMQPHSYAKTQYAELILTGVCKYEEIDTGYTKKYKIKFIDTPENNIAMDIAEGMLSGEDSPISSILEPDIDKLIISGVYNFTAEQRKIKDRERVKAKASF